MKKRFFKLSEIYLRRNIDLENNTGSIKGAILAKYSEVHLMETVKKMQLWTGQLDEKYFDGIDKKLLQDFTKACETFAYLLEMLYRRDIEVLRNPLFKAFRQKYSGPLLADLLLEYAEKKDVDEVDPLWRDEVQIIDKIEEDLTQFLRDIDYLAYSEKEIIAFYENISLRRNVWRALLHCQTLMVQLDFKLLERSRF
jgi:hypothetical protein